MTAPEREAALSREKKEENMSNSNALQDAEQEQPGNTANSKASDESKPLAEPPITASGAQTAQIAMPLPPNKYDMSLRVHRKFRLRVNGYSMSDAITNALIQVGAYSDTPGMHVEIEATRL